MFFLNEQNVYFRYNRLYYVCTSKFHREQLELVQQVRIEDVEDWAKYRVTSENSDKHPDVKPLRYIGGVDISFIKGDNVNACAAFVVLNYPELEVSSISD